MENWISIDSEEELEENQERRRKYRKKF